MICPLMTMEKVISTTAISTGQDCKDKNCAWWSNTECCIKAINIELIKIEEAIRDVAPTRKERNDDKTRRYFSGKE